MSISYSKPFDESKQWIADRITQSLSDSVPDLGWMDQLEDCIYVKNRNSKLLYSNSIYNRTFGNGRSNVGMLTSAYLDESMIEVSKHTDSLIFSGSKTLECEHVGIISGGMTYALKTFKFNLQGSGRTEYNLLGITRRIEPVKNKVEEIAVDLRSFLAKYQVLDFKDQEICRMVCLGLTSKEIADQHNLTPRAIELRKQKIFASLGIHKSIELARKLVRLEERGLLDIGL